LAFLAFFNYFFYSVDKPYFSPRRARSSELFNHKELIDPRENLTGGSLTLRGEIKITIRIGFEMASASHAHGGIMAQGTEFARVMAAIIFVTRNARKYWQKRVLASFLSSMFYDLPPQWISQSSLCPAAAKTHPVISAVPKKCQFSRLLALIYLHSRRKIFLSRSGMNGNGEKTQLDKIIFRERRLQRTQI
jgi:hypothetical protein